ncbi:NmrA family NAD(P)-binding protein [Methylobacterium sp. BTF04]|uniref:NmrA family NAD(P)-binding protein n=1 Tax=Methylobacterium sp. BTF04 TaxID=2708300 RepID=UPI0013D2F444|nr:NmrA family NAD(P)-binding protein [Methylobacterium sp. BTF04]NEU14620.1 NmrA family NAD(P)-binding protein [Methylobacterium sp. BTF04]
MNSPTSIPHRILLAGATGGLGLRIARELRERGASVTAAIRLGTAPVRVEPLTALGVEIRDVDLDDVAQVTAACLGVDCLVSALNGLQHTILGTQSVLLDAAVAAGVPRFIPSDFSLDFTRTPPGSNRNMDLRRAFKERLDGAPIQATSILNGAFMDMLTGQAPFILFGPRRVIHWGDADQPVDFTTMDDTAAYTAAVAMDPTPPRTLRIAGEVTSARDLAASAGAVAGRPFKTLRVGGIGLLGGMIKLTRLVAPGKDDVFPPWQGMQYMRDMYSGDGKLGPLDNDRYPGMRWTTVREVLSAR